MSFFVLLLPIIAIILHQVASNSGFAQEYSNTNYIPLITEGRPMVSKQVSSKRTCLLECMNVNDCSLVVYNEINNLCDMYNLFPLVEVELKPDDDTTVFVFNQTIELSPSVVNTSWLLSRLSTTNVKYTTLIADARSIEMDIFGYLLTLEALNNITYVDRFDRTTLALVKRTPLPILYTDMAMLSYHNNMIFISAPTNITYVFDHVNFTWLANITCGSSLNKPRNIIFMETLQLMIVSSYNNGEIFFFHMNSPTSYTFLNTISMPSSPEALLKINDTFFHATGFYDLSILSFSFNGSMWSYSLFVNVSVAVHASNLGIAGLRVDNLKRRWVALSNYGIAVYDEYGRFLGQIAIGIDPFDLYIANDYRIVIAEKVDPNLTLYDPQVRV